MVELMKAFVVAAVVDRDELSVAGDDDGGDDVAAVVVVVEVVDDAVVLPVETAYDDRGAFFYLVQNLRLGSEIRKESKKVIKI